MMSKTTVKPKKPTMKKLPRRPKRLTIAAMKKYLQSVEAVNRENARREAKYRKDLKTYEALKRKCESVSKGTKKRNVAHNKKR